MLRSSIFHADRPVKIAPALRRAASERMPHFRQLYAVAMSEPPCMPSIAAVRQFHGVSAQLRAPQQKVAAERADLRVLLQTFLFDIYSRFTRYASVSRYTAIS